MADPFIHLLPFSQGCALLILGSKGQGTLMIENGFRIITELDNAKRGIASQGGKIDHDL